VAEPVLPYSAAAEDDGLAKVAEAFAVPVYVVPDGASLKKSDIETPEFVS